MDGQVEQPTVGMSQLKLAAYIMAGIILLASIGGILNYIGRVFVEGIIEDIEEDFKNQPPMSWANSTSVVDDIETLSDFGYRKIDTVAHANAGDFVQFRFEDLGYEVEVQEFTTELCQDCRNYVATMEGQDPDSWIVVGGHYDAICYSQQIVIGIEYPGCTSEGAYDDATGTASVLELARLMMEWQENKR